MIAKSKVSGKNQVTVPKSIMKVLGMSPGDEVVFQSDGRQVILRAKNRRLLDWARELPVSVSSAAVPVTLEEMRAAVENGAVSGEEGGEGAR